MNRLPTQGILFAALLALAAAATASPVYRWTDEDGKVHFSEFPPDAKPEEATEHMSREIYDARSQPRPAPLQQRLQGDWQGERGGLATRLQFQRGGFSEYRVDPGRNHTLIYRGTWQIQESRITFSVQSYGDAAFSIEPPAAAAVIFRPGGSLEMHYEHGEGVTYRR
jgi:hypothetical protein